MSTHDSFIDLERHRLQLEQNVAKLQKSLRHWQAWEIEYEGLKEDIIGLGEQCSQVDLERLSGGAHESISSDSGTRLDDKERSQLLLDEKGNSRSRDQVLGLLSRRIDYVQQNVKSVTSLLHAAKEKYAASEVLRQPEVRNEEGLPLTEIIEELDDEGNVISSTTSKPGQTAPQLTEALNKAGLQVPAGKRVTDDEAPTNHEILPILADDHVPSNNLLQNLSKEQASKQSISVPSSSSIVHNTERRSSKPRKSVSFAENTKEAAEVRSQSKSINDTKTHRKMAQDSRPKTNGTPNREATANEKPDISFYDEDEDKSFNPVIPENESSEDAALRRQMIQYNMNEINPIVAELKVEEDEESCSDMESLGDDHDNSSIEEDEDRFGRANRGVLSSEYLEEMRNLEQKLKNVGPNPSLDSEASVSTRKDVTGDTKSLSNDAPSKMEPVVTKGVRFAEELDIQEKPARPTPKTPPTAQKTEEKASTIRKPIHAPTVIERPYSPTASTLAATEPDELDPALLRQEVSAEYHRRRNYMVQKQGGYADNGDDETAEVPLTEAEGGPKKVSRFKAARLNKASS